MEESLFNTNFIGKDGFRWWIGQVAPDIVQKPQTKDKKGCIFVWIYGGQFDVLPEAEKRSLG